MEKAKALIENCVHDDYKEQLWDYLKVAGDTHTPHTLCAAFAMHVKFQKDGDMRNINWNKYTEELLEC